ncbi:hypothetical protein [Acetivibrio cellulolyticus]|uniref:hypothetical protein n=1 Tax=Acetivibrio cellulolyticus TaxID=35830 RepID=UPI0001E2E7D1|nr:hypothetical protein [Acetivibrio cellulolyticus]
MKGYSYTEIGMLLGAAMGGAIAVLGFSIWNSLMSYILVGFSILLGIFAGKIVEKKRM